MSKDKQIAEMIFTCLYSSLALKYLNGKWGVFFYQSNPKFQFGIILTPRVSDH